MIARIILILTLLWFAAHVAVLAYVAVFGSFLSNVTAAVWSGYLSLTLLVAAALLDFMASTEKK